MDNTPIMKKEVKWFIFGLFMFDVCGLFFVLLGLNYAILFILGFSFTWILLFSFDFLMKKKEKEKKEKRDQKIMDILDN